jgi:hypothetical protein
MLFLRDTAAFQVTGRAIVLRSAVFVVHFAMLTKAYVTLLQVHCCWLLHVTLVQQVICHFLTLSSCSRDLDCTKLIIPPGEVLPGRAGLN